MTMQRDEVFRSKFLRLPETNSETLVRPRPASVGCSPNQEIKISRSRAFAVCIRSIGKAAKLAVEESEYGGPRFRREPLMVMPPWLATEIARSLNNPEFCRIRQNAHVIRRGYPARRSASF